jgi:hypothetical protein
MKPSNSGPPDPIHPSTSCSPSAASISAVREALEAAFTPEVRREVTAYAHRRWARVSRFIAWLSADDLVQDAIANTLDGTVSWAPAHALPQHLKRVINNRIRWERRHARAFPAPSLRVHNDAGIVAAELASAYVQAFQRERAAAEAWQNAIARFRAAARDDSGVLALLDAYEGGARTRQEVLEATGMTRREYAAAYARMRRSCRRDLEVGGAGS